jgi:hypothetical protein
MKNNLYNALNEIEVWTWLVIELNQSMAQYSKVRLDVEYK